MTTMNSDQVPTLFNFLCTTHVRQKIILVEIVNLKVCWHFNIYKQEKFQVLVIKTEISIYSSYLNIYRRFKFYSQLS